MYIAEQQADEKWRTKNTNKRWVDIAFTSLQPVVIDKANSHHSVRNMDPEEITIKEHEVPPVPTPEEIAHREALAFLAATDAKMTRTQEDMIDALGILSSLPLEVQDLKAARAAARLDLIPEVI